MVRRQNRPSQNRPSQNRPRQNRQNGRKRKIFRWLEEKRIAENCPTPLCSNSGNYENPICKSCLTMREIYAVLKQKFIYRDIVISILYFATKYDMEELFIWGRTIKR